MKKVVSILVFLGMGAFVSAQAIYDNLGLPKICKEIESPFALNDKGRLYFGDTTSIEFREKNVCGDTYVSNKKGWNSSDFEPYLRKYTIKYGDPIYKDTSRGYDMIWYRSVDKDYILNLRYVVPNSLAPAGIIIYVTKK